MTNDSSIIIRELEEDDLFNGFVHTLDSLRTTSDIEAEKAKKIFQEITSNPNHKIFVAIVNGKVVGTTTIFLEPKFIHNGGYVGHIEDVSVSREYAGMGIAKQISTHVLKYAEESGCYKTILNCEDAVTIFYKKLGFNKIGNGMRFDHNVDNENKSKVFVSIPLTKDFQKIRNYVVNYLENHGYVPILIENMSVGSSIFSEITKMIKQCDFIVADVSQNNPNVFYELGLAHGLKKSLFLIRNNKIKSLENNDLINEYFQLTYDESNLNDFANVFEKSLMMRS